MCARVLRNLIVVVDSLEEAYNGDEFNVVKVRNFASVELAEKRLNDYDRREDAVIFIGSQYLSNGSLLYLDIAKKIHSIKPHVLFYCVDRFDTEEFRRRFLSLVREYDLEDAVIMLPNVKPQEIMTYINRATIGISPNLNTPNQKKGIHTKMFEYMAGGIPIVASNHPYHISYIENNGAGLLANPDYGDEFVEKLLYLLNDRGIARKIGEEGLRIFKEKFCWEKEEEKIITMYREIL